LNTQIVLFFTCYSVTNGDRTYHKSLEVKAGAAFHPAHNVQEVGGEDKGHPFSVHPHEAFSVAQDVAKINVKQVA